MVRLVFLDPAGHTDCFQISNGLTVSKEKKIKRKHFIPLVLLGAPEFCNGNKLRLLFSFLSSKI